MKLDDVFPVRLSSNFCSEEDKYKFICSCSYSIQQLTLQSRSNHSIQHHSLLINTSRQNNRHTVQTTEYKDSDRDDDIIKLHTITTSSGKHMLHFEGHPEESHVQ